MGKLYDDFEKYFNSASEEQKQQDYEELKEYNNEQCVYGIDSTMPCKFCSATCPERYKDFKEKGVRMTWIDKDRNIVDY